MLTFEADVATLADAPAAGYLAVSDQLPEFVGRGETEQDACEDLCEQLNAVTWH